MTKVIILGEPAEKKEGKKIEFIYCIGTEKNDEVNRIKATLTPSDCDVIELIRHSNDQTRYDIMFGYGKSRNNGALYLGHFNDGIV